MRLDDDLHGLKEELPDIRTYTCRKPPPSHGAWGDTYSLHDEGFDRAGVASKSSETSKGRVPPEPSRAGTEVSWAGPGASPVPPLRVSSQTYPKTLQTIETLVEHRVCCRSFRFRHTTSMARSAGKLAHALPTRRLDTLSPGKALWPCDDITKQKEQPQNENCTPSPGNPATLGASDSSIDTGSTDRKTKQACRQLRTQKQQKEVQIVRHTAKLEGPVCRLVSGAQHRKRNA